MSEGVFSFFRDLLARGESGSDMKSSIAQPRVYGYNNLFLQIILKNFQGNF